MEKKKTKELTKPELVGRCIQVQFMINNRLKIKNSLEKNILDAVKHKRYATAKMFYNTLKCNNNQLLRLMEAKAFVKRAVDNY